MSGYYQQEDLAQFSTIGEEAEELWGAFSTYYQLSLKPGALSAREKALIGLAVAHALQCPYCIDSFAKGSLEKGADEEQMTEAVHVAAAVRAGATLVHGVQMKKRLRELTIDPKARA